LYHVAQAFAELVGRTYEVLSIAEMPLLGLLAPQNQTIRSARGLRRRLWCPGLDMLSVKWLYNAQAADCSRPGAETKQVFRPEACPSRSRACQPVVL
jgi:hypothetical protein